MSTNSVARVFQGKDPALRLAFDYLLQQLQSFGVVKVAPKQTSIHLEKSRGFAEVHPRKSYFNLEFRTDYQIDAPHITQVQQLSARRFEHTVKVASQSDIDEQLLMWLKSAYELSK